MTLQANEISPSTMPNPAEILKQQFTQSLGLPWTDILSESRLDEILEEENITYRTRIYTPIVTVWAMLHQVLSADKSLRNTVKAMTTWLTAAGITPPSSDTGAYSKARGTLARESVTALNPRSL